MKMNSATPSKSFVMILTSSTRNSVSSNVQTCDSPSSSMSWLSSTIKRRVG